MLPGWLEDLLTPCPWHLRRLGYLRELRGIRRRQRRWGSAWADHLENTKAVLREAVARATNRRKAVVFGSGWLSDVPLPELAAAFEEVVLVDAVHPRATRRQARSFRNVRLLPADVTDTLEVVYKVADSPRVALPRARPKLFDGEDVGLFASVNLLSQLPCLPEQYLLWAGAHTPEAIAAYSRGLVEAHLAYLRRLPGVVALVADVEVRTVDRAGQVVGREDTLFGARFPFEGRAWDWPLVPGKVLRVLGVVDVKTANPVT